jgi:hypothetical protein
MDPMTDMPRITLLPVGNPDRRALDDLARNLSDVGFDVDLRGDVPEQPFATNIVNSFLVAFSTVAIAVSLATWRRLSALGCGVS